MNEADAQQWVAHWRSNPDNYTRSKVVLVDKISSMVALTDLEIYELAGNGPGTLKLIIDLIQRKRSGES